jgi:sulfite exporter TauE/SafE
MVMIANTINLNFWGKKWYGKLFSSNKMYSFFLIGNLNGLLPCGFVYVALIASLATQSALSGAMFMASFGLGTFPVMFAISLLGQVINLKLRQKANLLMPVFAIVLGCIFILRGLNLGIPFVSPQIDNTEVSGNYCGPQH